MSVKLIHADNFFLQENVDKMLGVTIQLESKFVQKEYGMELENFNMPLPDMDEIFSKIVNEQVKVDEERSGIFRKPMNCIHFESFDSLNEWCFIVALEKTTFNLYHHLEDYGKINARSALDGYMWNYRNLMEWDVYTNIILEPNQGVIFRPWLFHSLQNGVVQYYRLIKQ